MKRFASFAITVLLLCFATSPIMAQGAISLDHVDGEGEPGQISAGGTVTFHIRLNNSSSYDLLGSTNGFRLYSPDGGTWSPIVGDTASIGWGEYFDGGLFLSPSSVTGSGADTIGFGGFAMMKPGMVSISHGKSSDSLTGESRLSETSINCDLPLTGFVAHPARRVREESALR